MDPSARMHQAHHRGLRAAFAAYALLSAVGCGEPAQAREGDTDSAESVDEPVADAGRDAGRVDAGRKDPGPIDAGRPMRPMPQRQCMPGQYAGEFSCLISGLLPWVGKISFALVEEVTAAGEFSTLSIVPGTRIMGSEDSMQGMFTAELEGDFDCTTGLLTGRLVNGKYLYAGVMEYQLEGPLEGRYTSDAGLPGFEGTMGKLTSSDFAIFGELGPSAMCTWQASRASDVIEDAGVDASR